MSSLESYESRFDEGGWLVFKGSIEEGRKRGERHILPEHFIRQLFVEDEDGKIILEKLGVAPEAFLAVIEERLESRRQHFKGGIRLDPEVIEMLKSASRLARAHGGTRIGKRDMLVALAQHEESALLQTFKALGIDPLRVVEVILTALAIDHGETPQTPVTREPLAQPFCSPGDTIRIKTGAFAAFSAKVADVDYERSALRVNVMIFGRSEPIELKFSDVEKITFD
jgi:transcription antitermination factor NusG